MYTFELQQIFTACSVWCDGGMNNQISTYDLFVREMPKNRNFLLFGGIEEVIENIKKWRYSERDVKNLLEFGIISESFANYLRNFKFTGEIYALPEGTVFFPGEPVIRIVAPLIEGNLLTMFLMNAITSNTIFLSKVIRSVIAAKNKAVITGAAMRAHSFESAFKYGRAAHIAGALGANTIPSFVMKYNLPKLTASVKAYHAVIKSFPSEIEAMRKTAELFPHLMDFMVDTYDTQKGIVNAITVALELKEKGNSIKGITIDSGDLYEQSVMARKMLDDAGLHAIEITLASNLDEYKIDDLIKRNVPANKFILVTEAITVADDPKLEIVYKLSEVRHQGKITQKAKLSKGKQSLPGRKQVFRVYENGRISKDIIGLEDENLGDPLLVKMMEDGKAVYDLPSLEKIREYTKDQIAKLPEHLKSITECHDFPVEISNKIQEVLTSLKESH
jgi:nicotinate phosphoribosyltransferase